MHPEFRPRLRTTVALLLTLLAFVGVLMFFLSDVAWEFPVGLKIGLLFAALLAPLLVLALKARPSGDLVPSHRDGNPRQTTIALAIFAVALFGGGVVALANGVGGSVLMVLGAIVGIAVVARIPRPAKRRG